MRRTLILAAALGFTAPAAAQQCMLEYQRADNSWAAAGRPDGPLGRESIALQPGQTKVFITDWKYEKQRNDGNNYYGSHARIVSNAGKAPIRLVLAGDIAGFLSGVRGALRQTASQRGEGILEPGASWNIRADIQEVACLASAKEAKAGSTPPGGVANMPAMKPPAGLTARQTSPNEIVLSWGRVDNAREYRVYVQPPPQPHLAGRPAVVGGSGTHFVIAVPPNAPANAVYQASIEAVGADGTVSPRVGFNPVSLQRPPASGSGSPSTTPGSIAQRCPAGQFVVGLDGSGRILCERPPG